MDLTLQFSIASNVAFALAISLPAGLVLGLAACRLMGGVK